jgi:hypothetical protein
MKVQMKRLKQRPHLISPLNRRQKKKVCPSSRFKMGKASSKKKGMKICFC